VDSAEEGNSAIRVIFTNECRWRANGTLLGDIATTGAIEGCEAGGNQGNVGTEKCGADGAFLRHGWMI